MQESRESVATTSPETGTQDRPPESYYTDSVGDKQYYKREAGGELPPFYVQKGHGNEAEVVVSDHLIGIADKGKGDRVAGRQEFAQELNGYSAKQAATELRKDGSLNKARGAVVYMAEDGIAYRSVEGSSYRVVVLTNDKTYTLGAEGNPISVYKPGKNEIIAIVDADTADALHQTPGYDGLRSMEQTLLESDSPYATITVTEEMANRMRKNRGMTAVAAGASPQPDDDTTPDQPLTRRQRLKNKKDHYLAKGSAVVGSGLFFLGNRVKQPKRRTAETDEQYEKRTRRRGAVVAAVGVVAVAAALVGLSKCTGNAEGVDSSQQLNDLLNPAPEFSPLPDVTVEPPDFSVPNIDLDPEPDVLLPEPDMIVDTPDVTAPVDVDEPVVTPEPLPIEEVPAPTPTEYGQDARTIDLGEGWYDTFDELGITNPEDKADLLANDDLMNRLDALNVAYPDTNLFGDWGIDMTNDGRMPEPALDAIMDEYAELDRPEGAVEDTEPATLVESFEGTAAQTIDPGEGWYQTFAEMGVTDPNEQYNLLRGSGSYQMMSELREMGLAYPYGDSWRMYMTDTGTLPSQALEIIAKHASARGYGLAA